MSNGCLCCPCGPRPLINYWTQFSCYWNQIWRQHVFPNYVPQHTFLNFLTFTHFCPIKIDKNRLKCWRYPLSFFRLKNEVNRWNKFIQGPRQLKFKAVLTGIRGPVRFFVYGLGCNHRKYDFMEEISKMHVFSA